MRRHMSQKFKGRQWKSHKHDCGHAQCGICHPEKFPKREITRKEELANTKFNEQINETPLGA